MALDTKKLNNIAGSIGSTNLWIYSTTDTAATIQAAGYFDGAVAFGMRDGDAGMFMSSDESYMAKIGVVAGVVTLTAFVELT